MKKRWITQKIELQTAMACGNLLRKRIIEQQLRFLRSSCLALRKRDCSQQRKASTITNFKSRSRLGPKFKPGSDCEIIGSNIKLESQF